MMYVDFVSILAINTCSVCVCRTTRRHNTHLSFLLYVIPVRLLSVHFLITISISGTFDHLKQKKIKNSPPSLISARVLLSFQCVSPQNLLISSE
jgi:hypothetical protein